MTKESAMVMVLGAKHEYIVQLRKVQKDKRYTDETVKAFEDALYKMVVDEIKFGKRKAESTLELLAEAE